MIGLKMLKIAYFGIQFIKFFSGGGFEPASLAVIVAIRCEIVLLKSLTMFRLLGN